jgi:hypothetical protein
MKPLPKSLWAATAIPATSYPRLEGDVAADCVIVGGGFTGLSTALHLAQRGLKTVLLEANEPGWGASGRNGGQVIPGLKLDPSELRAKYGEERGRRLTATVGATADLVFELIEQHGIACHARRNGWIQGAPGPKGLAEVSKRAEEWSALGADVAVLDRDEVRARVAAAIMSVRSWTGAAARSIPCPTRAAWPERPRLGEPHFTATPRPWRWSARSALEGVHAQRQRHGVLCRAGHERLHGSALAGLGADRGSGPVLRRRHRAAIRQSAQGHPAWTGGWCRRRAAC